MIEAIERWFWRRNARKAVAEGLVTTCGECGQLVIPGDFVSAGKNPANGQPVVIHAGYQLSLTKERALCGIVEVGNAIWNGTQVLMLK